MNSQLYDKSYNVPRHIIERIRAKLATVGTGTKGIKRGKFIVNNGQCTYSVLKRLKNYFDYCNPNDVNQRDEYDLAGGRDMQSFVERTLGADRNLAKSRKASHVNFTPQLDNSLSAQDGSVNMSVNEEYEGLMKNGLAVIFTHGDGPEKVLLLKRPDGANWSPSTWALVGGKLEDGETPAQGTTREIFEETGLKINNFIGDFIIRTTGDHIEYVFVASIEGEPAVTICDESTEYGWFETAEIPLLETSPHLEDFIALARQKLLIWQVDNSEDVSL